MRRISLAVVTTIAGLVLLFSYRTSTSGPVSGAGGAVAAPTAPPGQSTSSAGGVMVNGSAEDDGFGPVQVQVTIAGGRITDVRTLQMPRDGHSRRINSRAVPQLRQEVLDAQSARVDTISGATATSEAYRRSLQAALDAAHFTGS